MISDWIHEYTDGITFTLLKFPVSQSVTTLASFRSDANQINRLAIWSRDRGGEGRGMLKRK